MAKQKAAPPPEAVVPEAYTVLARRYRPQQFSDLVGQEPVAQALINALKSNRVAHAYLFTGARGVGKTSSARILAKALNCVKGPTPTPCDKCDCCLGIMSGDDVDVLEIDGASNTGVDKVREIRSNVQYRPSRAKYKIYIIDEVHMLSTAAFNALLKTLEEPPAHVKFIFATTEVQKIPVTILSRCQRFDFAGIGTPRIVERLKEVVAAEGLKADEEALELVARRAGGSMRDAQSLLDQLLAFGSERLTADQVHRLLGTANDDRVMALAGAIFERDPAAALQILGDSSGQGLQLGELIDQLLAYWRDLMVVQCAGQEARDLSMPPRHRATLAAQAGKVSLDTILAGLDILGATKTRLRGSSHGQTLLEMAVVRLARLEDMVPLTQLAQWLGKAEAPSAAAPAQAPRASLSASLRPATPPEAEKKKALESNGAAEQALPLNDENLAQIWSVLLAQVGPMLAADLQKSESHAIFGPNALALSFSTRYNLQRDLCQEPATVARIEAALQKITGQKCQFRVESTGGDVTAAQIPAAADAASAISRNRSKRAEVEQVPLLRRAFDVLEAQVVHVDDGFGAAPVAGAERPDSADAMTEAEEG